jgi:hypothetical protein
MGDGNVVSSHTWSWHRCYLSGELLAKELVHFFFEIILSSLSVSSAFVVIFNGMVGYWAMSASTDTIL